MPGGAMLFRKQYETAKKIDALFNAIDKCVSLFKDTVSRLIVEGPTAQNDEAAMRVHDAEGRVDDIVREIEIAMYENALIPESRGDVLGILESIDKIPDTLQSLVFQLSHQNIKVPYQFKDTMLRLVDVNLEAYVFLKEAVINLFYNKDVQALISQIDRRESTSDKIVRELIKAIFNCQIDKADKILLKQIVSNIGDISDFCEDTTGRLRIAIIKRRI